MDAISNLKEEVLWQFLVPKGMQETFSRIEIGRKSSNGVFSRCLNICEIGCILYTASGSARFPFLYATTSRLENRGKNCYTPPFREGTKRARDT